MAAFANTHPKDSLVESLSHLKWISFSHLEWISHLSYVRVKGFFSLLFSSFSWAVIMLWRPCHFLLCYCRHECLLAFSLLKSTTQTLFVQHNAEETCLCETFSSVFHDCTSTPQGTIKITAFEVALAALSYQQPTTDGWRLTGDCSLYFWLIVKWSFRRPYTFLF